MQLIYRVVAARSAHWLVDRAFQSGRMMATRWWRAAVASLLALSAAAVVLDEDIQELANMVRDNCIAETGVDVELINQVDAGADLMPDPTFKCYIKCAMEMAGIMSSGEVFVDALLALLPDEFLKHNAQFFRNCNTQHGDDECDTAFRTQVCWQNANKAAYFLI